MRDLYLKAAQMSPEQVDPDIQVCACVCFTCECVPSHASVCLHMRVCASRECVPSHASVCFTCECVPSHAGVCFTCECVPSHASVCFTCECVHASACAGLIAGIHVQDSLLKCCAVLCRLVWVCCLTCQTSITRLWTASMLHWTLDLR